MGSRLVFLYRAFREAKLDCFLLQLNPFICIPLVVLRNGGGRSPARFYDNRDVVRVSFDGSGKSGYTYSHNFEEANYEIR